MKGNTNHMRKPTTTSINRPNPRGGTQPMKRLLAGATVLAVLLIGLIPMVALADHVNDGGVDQAWDNAMNQESYWEGVFGPGAECTQFTNHSGFIPAQYDAAVIKDGNMVRVYADLTNVGAFTAIGAVNPSNSQHFGSPHSWVMKCTIEEPPPPPVCEFNPNLPVDHPDCVPPPPPPEPQPPNVTAECATLTIDAAEGVEWTVQIDDGVVDGEGTDMFFAQPGQMWSVSYEGEVIASGIFEECTPGEGTTTTTTTTPLTEPTTTTTTTIPSEGTAEPTTTTTLLSSTTTTSTLATLPFTGEEDVPLAYLAAGLGLLGLMALVAARREGEDNA